MTDTSGRCPGCRRSDCGGCGIFQKLNTNKQLRVQFPEAFCPEPGEGLGISFDVGTTTLAGMLWDLKTGALLDAETAANPQAVFGVDVVSRIRAAMESGEKLARMQEILAGKLDEMARRMAGGDRVVKAVVAGNPVMCGSLMGIRPEGLSCAPFTPDYQGTLRFLGKDLGMQFLRNGEIIFLPPIGGFVGADALAVYSYVNLAEPGKRVLAVDVGTNGEILLQCGGRRYACSAAAGPALEGGIVGQGMRAVPGAIDRVVQCGRFPQQDIVCRVIGAGTPTDTGSRVAAARGICGSGLVDALAVLYRAGVLDDTGYMRSSQEARAAGTPERILRRIRGDGRGRRFLLTGRADPVFLSAGDVRALQMSVGAIRAGSQVLLEKAGLSPKQLDKIYLAGAFGSYIDPVSGMTIGLFPEVPREKLVQAGNLAGTGAAMALLSEKMLTEMEKLCGDFEHVELAEEPGFGELFLSHMNFPFISEHLF